MTESQPALVTDSDPAEPAPKVPLTAEFWIATGPKRLHGRRKLGPFVSRDLALTVRTYVEKVERRDDLWVVDGEDVPDDV